MMPPTANVDYSFLSQPPPKRKHIPEPIMVRRMPSRSFSRPTSSRRRGSGSASPGSFLTLVDTPTSNSPDPQTPHLTSHGYVLAFSPSYQRCGLIPDTPRSARRSPNSPKRVFSAGSPKRTSGSVSPKRRHHRMPHSSSPPASPTRAHTRPRSKSTARPAAPTSVPSVVPSVPKLSKIRSLTNLRSSSPAPPPPRSTALMFSTTNTAKQSSKRSKRSATPARGSATYAKYRPMPFIQHMQLAQLLEGGTLDYHIRKNHVGAKGDATNVGFAAGQEVHGYTFTDERGMIWFDEEEEWEFTCLLPRSQPQPKRGIKSLLNRKRYQESEDEWEDFADSDESEDDVDPATLLARGDDDLRADEDDLAAFGGSIGKGRIPDFPKLTVLDLPHASHVRRNKRRREIQDPLQVPPFIISAPAPVDTATLRQEFLSTAFDPSPALPLPAVSSTPAPLPRTKRPFRLFANRRHGSPMLGSSKDGVDITLRDDTDGTDANMLRSVSQTSDQPREPISSSVLGEDRKSVSPPPAAARRLGIDSSATVSLHPAAPIKKTSFFQLRLCRN